MLELPDSTDMISTNDNQTGLDNQAGLENPTVNIAVPVTVQAPVESGTQKATHSETETTSVSLTTDAAVENNTENQSDAVHLPNATTNAVDTESKESKTTLNQSKKNEEPTHNSAEDGNMNNDNDKGNEKESSMVSTEDDQDGEFTNKRIAKQFRVLSTNKIHQDKGGKVNKIYFGTVGDIVPGAVKMWKIIYDDGDVDVMSHTEVSKALQYYEGKKGLDTNHAHKKPLSLLPQSNDEGKKGATGTSSRSNAKKRGKNVRAKGTPPKKGKNVKAKVGRKEALPIWTGPPDEKLEGGWPSGWVKKVFSRKNGASKGSTDRYWYSPNDKIKLRSMVQVTKFLKALEKTKGDEKEAKKIMFQF
mmetsp:Transcript_26402/g.56606  ORF Transcript_26402/g.56606 Transcript_26402/m.56606 type:complete len:360 (+) Transcript_26402:32-1111(+)